MNYIFLRRIGQVAGLGALDGNDGRVLEYGPMTTEEIERRARAVTAEERPVPQRALSGIGNFFALYGGEHIAATEFVIGALLVTWGAGARMTFLGLILGNILATFTFALLTAPIAVDTHLSLYAYLRKAAGPYFQKVYNALWGVTSVAWAATMVCISASALRECFGFPIQTHWYPTSVGLVVATLVLGAVVTVVSSCGFRSVARFSALCAPWMVVIFFCGAMASLPQLYAATGCEHISGLGSFLDLADKYIFGGNLPPGEKPLTVWHVAGFAWMCNLVYHGGLNDMSLFRFAKRKEYGYVAAVGMFIGHFFAWAAAGFMGATAAILLKTPITGLDSGAVTWKILGAAGLLAVVAAGWTTANPNIYRASLALGPLFPKLKAGVLSAVIGTVMTVLACFPCAKNIDALVSTVGLIVPAIGAICLTEHWILPKFGGKRFWCAMSGAKLNLPALGAWLVSIAVAALVIRSGAVHRYFICLPAYFAAAVSYLVLALCFGARRDYGVGEADFRAVERRIAELAEAEAGEGNPDRRVSTPLVKLLRGASFLVLGAIVALSFAAYASVLSVDSFKALAIGLSVGYFAVAGLASYLARR